MSTGASETLNEQGPETARELQGKLLIRLVIFTLIMAAIWYAASGRLNLVMAWVFIVVWLFVGGIVPTLIVPLDPELIEERTQIKKDIKAWDKLITILGSLFTPLGILVVAGLDARFGWSPPIPLGLQIATLVLGALGYLLSVWASSSNKFYARFVRIQKERGHFVVSGGPYRYVRHPGYAGLIVFYLTSALTLGSLWTLVPNGLMALLLIVRTALEDEMLQQELDGYREYAGRVRYRLLPGVW